MAKLNSEGIIFYREKIKYVIIELINNKSLFLFSLINNLYQKKIIILINILRSNFKYVNLFKLSNPFPID